ILERGESSERWMLADARVAVAACLLAEGRPADARALLMPNLEDLTKQFGPGDPRVRYAEGLRARLEGRPAPP
ncbi:MAG: hypothetical protein AAF725_05060, partial [Acidobacteriota bacterium]